MNLHQKKMSKTKIEFELDIAGIVNAIDTGGTQGLRLAGDFVAIEAKARAPQRTGQLVNSIQAQPVEGNLSEGTASITIGAGAPYAGFVEFGTGIHAGGERIWIEPVNRRALRFPVAGGGFAFSSGHYIDGMKAQPYLVPAVEENIGPIGDILASAIDNALDKVGK